MWFTKKSLRSPVERRVKLRMEELETRAVPYSVSGNLWPSSQLVSISFMPDGTDLGGVKSNLFSTMNARFGSPTTWQNQILKAAQVYAKNTNLNFVVVPDNGKPSGAGDYQQGDPGLGDIRVGGYHFGTSALAMAFAPPPVNNYSIAGDIAFNTGQTWNIGTTYDLFSVATHEFGHALGLSHSSTQVATMYSAYTGAKTGIDWDDIYGIRSLYSGGAARSADWNDANGGNGSFASATDITQHIQSNLTILRENRDISTCSDVDFFKVTVPSGATSSIQIRAQSIGLSSLAAAVTVYAADQTTVLGSANGLGQYGVNQTVTLTNKISAGQAIYVKVQGADTTPFGTGKYAIAMSFGGAELPAQVSTDTELPNGSPISAGGGEAMMDRIRAAGSSADKGHDDAIHGGGCGCPACHAAAVGAARRFAMPAATMSDAVVSHSENHQSHVPVFDNYCGIVLNDSPKDESEVITAATSLAPLAAGTQFAPLFDAYFTDAAMVF